MTNSNGRLVDLDQARAARLEATGDPITLRFQGTTFTLPAEIPFTFVDASERGDLREMVAALLGEQADEFFALNPSMPDIDELAGHLGPLYGIELGESAASPSSSGNGGSSSRPTSNASTA